MWPMRESRTQTVVAMRVAVVGLSFLLAGTALPAFAYEPETHGRISEVAVDRSSLDRILKDQFGLTQGTEFVASRDAVRNSVRQWIALGANQEDVPSSRAVNHFHNPLQPWREAGGLLGQSSIYWQQNPSQGPGGTWSWAVARRRFFEFLTLSGKGEREAALSDTARALGQVMHMVQDATSPPHTRDDPHLIHDGYEARVEELRQTNLTRFEQLLTAPSLFPSPSIFTPTGDPQAPVPIARLIDSDTYQGTVGSYTTGGQIGLAEYSNGGYVSDDTIFLDFPLPRRASLAEGFLDPPLGTPGSRQYFPKVADGDTVGHFVAEGTLFERLRFRGQFLGGFILDDRVYEDYAARLLPRAVGYGAGLLDYFLRGRFEVALVPSTAVPNQVELRATNRSPEPLVSGTLSLYFDDAAGVRCPVPTFGSVRPENVAASCPPGAGALPVADVAAGNPVFTTPLTFQAPAGAKRFTVVYRGQLGSEPDAVIGKVFGQPFEVVFIGTVNGINGFYLASDRGLFRIGVRDHPLFSFRLFSISWGANDNILLISYDPEGPDPNILQIQRINRPKGSSVVPTKALRDLETGLEFVDTTVLGEFVEQPNFPLPGTMTSNVKVNVKRFLAGVTTVTTFQTTRTDFNPLSSDTVIVNFTGSTNINLDRSQQARPSATFARRVHAFVDENDQLIMLYKIIWILSELVRGQTARVRSLGTLPIVPATAVDPNRLCSSILPSENEFSAGVEQPLGTFSSFLGVSATEFCTMIIEPAVPPNRPKSLSDYVLVNRSTGQILAQSFTSPAFSWEEDIHVLSGFQTHIDQFPRDPNNPFSKDRESILYTRHVQLSDVAPFPNNDFILNPKSNVFNFTATGRGLFGVTAGPQPFLFAQSQGTKTLVSGFVFTFNTFTNTYKDAERELFVNENFSQFFSLRNNGGLALLARNNNFPNNYRVARLALPAQAGGPMVAQVLTNPLTPPTRNSFDTILEANESAILAKFHQGFTLPPLKTLFISGTPDTVREILAADLPGDLRVVSPNAFINDTSGNRKEQTPVFTNGTVAFIQNAVPEKDLLVANTFPNVTTLEVKSGTHKPQWHVVGGGP